MLSAFVLVLSMLNFGLTLFVLWSQYVARVERSAPFEAATYSAGVLDDMDSMSGIPDVLYGCNHPTPEAVKSAEKTRAVIRTGANWNPYA